MITRLCLKTAQEVRVVHNEGHQRPVYGRRIRRGQHSDVREVDEEFTELGGRHHRADSVRLYIWRQVHRPGCIAVRRPKSVD